MSNFKQRVALLLSVAAATLALLVSIDTVGTIAEAQTPSSIGEQAGNTMTIQYLEIVTPEVDATCRTYEQLHGVTFGDPVEALGGARVAQLLTGSVLAVRAPLRTTEQPVVRPYLLVQDIEASVAKAAASGAKIALPPMRLPGHGTCAIYIQGGIEHGMWQAESEPE